MRLIVRVVPLALSLIAVAGCHSPAFLRKHHAADKACVENDVYLKAASVPSLKTPEGLAPPNTKNSLKIPDASGQTAPTVRTTKQGCLDKAPTFFGDKAKPAAVPAAPAPAVGPGGPAEKPEPPKE